ncbi:MAG: hypothetical protein JXQ75_16055 [Phycisphaerae bacterium]|nr:hypothetical protein [Phycisphaerae bacterium]
MDARKKKVLTVLCIGSVILTWRVYALIVKQVPSAAEAGPALTSVYDDSAGNSNQYAESQKDMAGIWEQQAAVGSQPWGRDPFADVQGARREPEPRRMEETVPDRGPPPEAPSLNFTGVSMSDGQWLAVVRRSIVRVGDVIDEEFRVTDITKRSVTISSRGWAFRYELGVKEPVVRPLWEEP